MGEAAVKVISLACTTCDLETYILILTMFLNNIFEKYKKVKYFRKVFKYKYKHFSFLKVKYKYFERQLYFQIQMYLTACLMFMGG